MELSKLFSPSLKVYTPKKRYRILFGSYLFIQNTLNISLDLGFHPHFFNDDLPYSLWQFELTRGLRKSIYNEYQEKFYDD